MKKLVVTKNTIHNLTHKSIEIKKEHKEVNVNIKSVQKKCISNFNKVVN